MVKLSKRRSILMRLLRPTTNDLDMRESVLYRNTHWVSLLLYGGCFTFTFYCWSSGGQKTHGSEDTTQNVQVYLTRRLMSSTGNGTTTPHTSEGLPWEGCEFEKLSPHTSAWVVHHLWWVFFLFIGLAVVCDDFFVPALEVISEKLKLSEDVAGATFMAAGSSAPELFTSIMGVAQKTDVGVGAIVGSAVFNILVIIALTGALAGQVLQLDWRPLVRDIVFYAISILVFMGVAYDGTISWFDAVFLLLLYVVYILVMVFNSKIMLLLGKCSKSTVEASGEVEGGKTTDGHVGKPSDMSHLPQPASLNLRRLSFQKSSFSGGHARRLSIHHQLQSQRRSSSLKSTAESVKRNSVQLTKSGDGIPNEVDSPKAAPLTQPETKSTEEITDKSQNEDSQPCHESISTAAGKKSSHVSSSHPDNVENADEIVICKAACCPRIKSTPPICSEELGCWSQFIFILKWILYIIAFPYYFLCTFTIPDCSKEHNKKWYLLTFLMSIVWILALSFAMVTLVTRAGCIINIDEFVMGLIIVAIGTSVPDCLSSILVARDGFGDMAVSNAIGSNVFDIDLGLGLPFLLTVLIQKGRPVSLLDESEIVLKEAGLFPIIPHVKFALVLLGLLLIISLFFILSKFRLNKFISISFVILYVLFIAYALVQQIVCRKYLC